MQRAAVACADQTKSRRREPNHAHAALILRVTCHERLIVLSKQGLKTHFSNALPKIKQNKPNLSFGHDLRAGPRADFAQPIFSFFRQHQKTSCCLLLSENNTMNTVVCNVGILYHESQINGQTYAQRRPQPMDARGKYLCPARGGPRKYEIN